MGRKHNEMTENTETTAVQTEAAPVESAPTAEDKPLTIAEEMEAAQTTEGNGEENGSKKDQSNRPVYWLVGEHPTSDATTVLCTYPTIHQAANGLPKIFPAFSAVYKNVRLVKVRRVEG